MNIIASRRRFKKKITTKGGKGQDEQAKADEEAKRLAQRLQVGCKGKKKRKEKLHKRHPKKQKKRPDLKKKKGK